MKRSIQPGGGFLVSPLADADIFTPEEFSDEQRQIAETTEEFVTNEILPKIDEIEAQNFDVVVEGMRKCGELGLLMIDTPEAYGGLELDKATSMLVADRFGPAGSFSVAFAAHTGIGTLPLVYYGTEDQKERYLEKLITGEWMAAYCLTEPDSGSDALAAKTTAVLSEDKKHYILNGNKQYITNGGFANLFTVFAKVDKEHFTAFLIERTCEGLSIGKEEKKMGIKGSSTTPVHLDNVKVPVENVLGEIGKGHKIAFNVLNIGRFKLGAAVTGAARNAMIAGLQYANVRKQFGQTIGSFGAIQEKVADMTAAVFASESVVYRLAGLLDTKLETIEKGIDGYYETYLAGIEDYAAECAISKVFCSEVLALVVDEVVQIHGGYGFISEYPAERYYRDERINRIFEGTNEINRLLLTGIILKKGLKGELPLQKKAMAAFEQLMTPSFDEPDPAPYLAETTLVENLKTLYLALSGAAVQKFGPALQKEQEILMAAADLTIEIFALESAIVRCRKQSAGASDRRKGLYGAVAKVAAFAAAERAATAGRKLAFYVEEGDTLTMLLSGVRRFTKYDASGLLAAKRLLAKEALEGEKYLF